MGKSYIYNFAIIDNPTDHEKQLNSLNNKSEIDRLTIVLPKDFGIMKIKLTKPQLLSKIIILQTLTNENITNFSLFIEQFKRLNFLSIKPLDKQDMIDFDLSDINYSDNLHSIIIRGYHFKPNELTKLFLKLKSSLLSFSVSKSDIETPNPIDLSESCLEQLKLFPNDPAEYDLASCIKNSNIKILNFHSEILNSIIEVLPTLKNIIQLFIQGPNILDTTLLEKYLLSESGYKLKHLMLKVKSPNGILSILPRTNISKLGIIFDERVSDEILLNSIVKLNLLFIHGKFDPNALLAELVHNTKLTNFKTQLCCNKGPDCSDELINLFKYNNTLERLTIGSNYIFTTEALAALKYNHILRYLELWNRELSPSEVELLEDISNENPLLYIDNNSMKNYHKNNTKGARIAKCRRRAKTKRSIE